MQHNIGKKNMNVGSGINIHGICYINVVKVTRWKGDIYGVALGDDEQRAATIPLHC